MCTPVALSRQKPYTSHLAIQLHSPVHMWDLCQLCELSEGYSLRGVQDIKSSRPAITAGLIKKKEQMSI